MESVSTIELKNSSLSDLIRSTHTLLHYQMAYDPFHSLPAKKKYRIVQFPDEFILHAEQIEVWIIQIFDLSAKC